MTDPPIRTSRWRGIEPAAGLRALRARDDFWPLVALGGLLLLGGVLRVWLLLAWRPAILGFPDEAAYLRVAAAHAGPEADPLHPVGYPVFLMAVHGLGAGLMVTMLVQHLLGMASAVLLFATARRAGAPAWAALLPAIVVLLCGDGIFLEQTVLSEPLFIFLSCAALYSAVRTDDSRRAWAWGATAGLLLGLATTVRTVGVVLIGVVAVWLLVRRPPGRGGVSWRRSLIPGLSAALISVAIVLAYAGWHDASAGGFELTTNGAYILYGRVAPWADCRDFKPPRGAAILCQSIPPGHRPGAGVYMFGGSPATAAFGFAGLPLAPASAEKLQAFAVAAIEHQPLTYLWTIVEKFLRVVSPGAGTPGEGQTPTTFLPYITSPAQTALDAPVARAMYGGRAEVTVASSARALKTYDSHTHVAGVFMAVLIVLAAVAPLAALRHGPRRRALLVTMFAFALLLAPLATVDYDYRYVIPATGPLAAAAAVGAAALWRRWVMPAAGRRRADRRLAPGEPG